MLELIEKRQNIAKKSLTLRTLELLPGDIKPGEIKTAFVLPRGTVIHSIYAMCELDHTAGVINISSYDLTSNATTGLLDINIDQQTEGSTDELLVAPVTSELEILIVVAITSVLSEGRITVCIGGYEPRLRVGMYTEDAYYRRPAPAFVAPLPTMTVLGTNPLSITELTGYVDAGATAKDYLDNSLVVTTGGDFVDTAVVGTYIVLYSATDSFGGTVTDTRTVSVIANEAPVVTLLGVNPISIEQNLGYVDPGSTAVDAEDGVLPTNIDLSSVDTSVLGSYLVHHSATDSGGKTTTVDRTVNVVAFNNPPVVTILGFNPDAISAEDLAPLVKLNGFRHHIVTDEDQISDNISPLVKLEGFKHHIVDKE